MCFSFLSGSWIVTTGWVPREIVLAVILLGALAFFAQDTYALSDFSFGPSGVSAKFQRRMAALEYDVSALRVAITGLVTKHEWDHLAKLHADGQALAAWRDDRRLEAELYRLDAIQFLEAVDKRGSTPSARTTPAIPTLRPEGLRPAHRCRAGIPGPA